jgi:hypothetical protein
MNPTTPILFPDAEALAIAVLTTALGNRPEPYAQDVYLAATEPATRRRRQVVVRRDGGRRLDFIRDAPRLSFRVWGRDEAEAGDLAQLVAALLGAAADGSTPLARVSTTGPYRVPGTDYRLLTAEFVVKGSPLA